MIQCLAIFHLPGCCAGDVCCCTSGHVQRLSFDVTYILCTIYGCHAVYGNGVGARILGGEHFKWLSQ
jgi:hypothetical protein